MKLKELKLEELEIIKRVAEILNAPVEDVLDYEVHMEYDTESMVKWLKDEDRIEAFIHELAYMNVIDERLSLLDNVLLNTKNIVKVGEYILFFMI